MTINKASVALTMSYAGIDSYISPRWLTGTNNTHTLFVMVDKLSNPPKQIAEELLSTEKCSQMNLIAWQQTVIYYQTDHQHHTVKQWNYANLYEGLDTIQHNWPK